uniref:Protein PHLOEM PROTEIN 2-LIKE A9 n=1 Tax=Salix viminalis TaxID=40686 RepID=A0A6N2JZC5_SALVM
MCRMSSRTWLRCRNFPAAPRNTGRLLYSLQDKEESTAGRTEAGERMKLGGGLNQGNWTSHGVHHLQASSVLHFIFSKALLTAASQYPWKYAVIDEDEVRWRFKPRQLDITWGDDSQYWKMPEEGTDGPAELLKVAWLEINGSTPKPLPKGKKYALSFKISMAHDDPVWRTDPVYMLAKVGKKGTSNWEKINLGDMRVGDIIEIPSGKLRFTVPEKAKDTTLLFGLYERWGGKWKKGLRIHEAVVEEMPD